MSKALVLLSGGQDSATCLFWAKREFTDVEAVSFRYGQRHADEIELAERMAQEAGVPWGVMDLPVFAQSALVPGTSSQVVEEQHNGFSGLPASFVPGRNALFLLLAGIKAVERGCEALVIGVSGVDYSGYPDCRPEFIAAMEKAINLALESSLRVVTPLIQATKKDTWKMAQDLGVFDLIRTGTLTCYNGSLVQNVWGRGCGSCPSCVLRKRGFEEYVASV